MFSKRSPMSLTPVFDFLLLILAVGLVKLTATQWQRERLDNAVQAAIAGHAGFWQHRSQELCGTRPPLPALAHAREVLGEEQDLERVATYRDAVWEEYADCLEERVVEIPESLLRFTFNRWDAFDMEPWRLAEAKERIRGFVDEHKDRRRIIIRGHCDKFGDDDTNYVISFRRALYVAQIVRDHLATQMLPDGRKLRLGHDYFVIPIGMGRTVPVERRPGEDENDPGWRGRCRRIELAFQRIRPGAKT
jgi:outer membrane protein OmpA-like peptidoglycan-associated protein